jgi:hypothetical protein
MLFLVFSSGLGWPMTRTIGQVQAFSGLRRAGGLRAILVTVKGFRPFNWRCFAAVLAVFVPAREIRTNEYRRVLVEVERLERKSESPIHCSIAKLLTFGTLTVRSSLLFTSPFQK